VKRVRNSDGPDGWDNVQRLGVVCIYATYCMPLFRWICIGYVLDAYLLYLSNCHVCMILHIGALSNTDAFYNSVLSRNSYGSFELVIILTYIVISSGT